MKWYISVSSTGCHFENLNKHKFFPALLHTRCLVGTTEGAQYLLSSMNSSPVSGLSGTLIHSLMEWKGDLLKEPRRIPWTGFPYALGLKTPRLSPPLCPTDNRWWFMRLCLVRILRFYRTLNLIAPKLAWSIFQFPHVNFLEGESSSSDLVRILSLIQSGLVRAMNLSPRPTTAQGYMGEKIASVKGEVSQDRTLISPTVTVTEWNSFFIL